MINIPTEDTNCFEQPFKADQKNNLDVLMCYFIFFPEGKQHISLCFV